MYKTLHLLIPTVLLASAIAQAEPPYTVNVNLTAGSDATSHVLLLDGAEVGPLVAGDNEFPDLLTSDGTYTFQAMAINQYGQTLSDSVPVTINLPGKPSISVTISFQVQ